MLVVMIKPVFAGINMSLIPPGCEIGAYVTKREYDELKEMYENLLYVSQELAKSKRTSGGVGEVQEVRVGVSEGDLSSV